MAGLIVATKPDVIVDNYPLVLSGVVVLESTLRLQYSMNLFRLKEAENQRDFGAAAILVLGVVLILVPMLEDFI